MTSRFNLSVGSQRSSENNIGQRFRPSCINNFDNQTLSSLDGDSVSARGTPTNNIRGIQLGMLTTFHRRFESPKLNSDRGLKPSKLRLTSTSTFSSTDGRRQSVSDDDSGCVLDDYAARLPPTLPHDLVYEYLKCLPIEKVPYLNSIGEEWRKTQLAYQQPVQDSNPKYCKSTRELQTRQCFEQWKREAAGCGFVKVMNFDEYGQCSCRLCGMKIFAGEIVVCLDQQRASEAKSRKPIWHPACFSCSMCNELLVDLNYCSHDEKVYCGRHHAEIFKPRCPACDEIIFANEGIEAEGVTYHIEHFICSSCHTPVGENKYVIKENSGPICLVCYEKQNCQTFLHASIQNCTEYCAACRQPFTAEDAKLTHGRRFWHASNHCFACRHCRRGLLGKSFLKEMSDNDALFCDKLCKIAYEEASTEAQNVGQTGLSSSKQVKSRDTKMLARRSQTADRIRKKSSNQSDKKNQQQFNNKSIKDNNNVTPTMTVSVQVHETTENKNKQSRCLLSEKESTNRAEDVEDLESNYASISPRIQRPIKKLLLGKSKGSEFKKLPVEPMTKSTFVQMEPEVDSDSNSGSRLSLPNLNDFDCPSTSLCSTFVEDREEYNMCDIDQVKCSMIRPPANVDNSVQPYVTTILPKNETTFDASSLSTSSYRCDNNKNKAKTVHFCTTSKSNYDASRYDTDSDDSESGSSDSNEWDNHPAKTSRWVGKSQTLNNKSRTKSKTINHNSDTIKSNLFANDDSVSTTSSEDDDDDIAALRSLNLNEKHRPAFNASNVNHQAFRTTKSTKLPYASAQRFSDLQEKTICQNLEPRRYTRANKGKRRSQNTNNCIIS